MKKALAPIKEGVDRFLSSIASLMDSFSSGGTPFVSSPSMAFRPPPRSSQDDAYMMMLGAQQGGVDRLMGYAGASEGPGPLHEMYNALLRPGAIYPYSTGKPIPLQEGKVNVQVKLTRIDKEHVLVEVECIQRIVHNAKELRELTAKLIETHAEEFLFGELAKRDIGMGSQTRDPVAKEPPGAIREVSKK